MHVASFEGRREQDIMLRLHSPRAVWRKLADVFCPKTNWERLASLEKFDGMKIGAWDDLEEKLLEMEGSTRLELTRKPSTSKRGPHPLHVCERAAA